jgi:putative transposase
MRKSANLYCNTKSTLPMLTLLELTACLGSLYPISKLAQFLDVFNSFFESTITTTTRSLSRYSNQSLRTWFRFLSASYDWITIRVHIFGHFCFDVERVYIYIADESVEGKSGKSSHGLSKFYSSIAAKAINGVCFFGISLVDVKSGTSFVLGVQQVIYNAADKLRIAESKAKKANRIQAKKEGVSTPKGRKKGTKNKVKIENPTASFRAFKTLFNKVTGSITAICPKMIVSYLVVDTAYGTLAYQELADAVKLHIISKFKSVASLYFPFEGENNIKGRPRIYGVKINTSLLPNSCLKQVHNDEEYKTETYQLQAYAKNTFGQKLLNIVIQRKVRVSDGRVATNIWFSTDLKLDFQTLLDYYSLRFHSSGCRIEFDFRDAKQHFGLSDFKNYKEENLTNFVNLSFTMCLIAKVQLAHYRKILHAPKLSIIDLKLIYKARFTAKNILKLVQKDTNAIFNEQFCEQFLPQDLINAA